MITPDHPAVQPYSHESRHRHARHRFRGSSGRLLGSKKLEHGASDSTRQADQSVIGSGFRRSDPNTAERVADVSEQA
ncbi:hypothetical protein Droror1_Dr00005945 [Drosera rotundifolia]